MAGMESGRSALWELYTEITTLSGWSMRDIAERSTRLGAPGLSKSRVGQLVNAQPLEAISRDNIVSLADGLGVTAERVALAALQSMGFRLADEGITPAEAIARDPYLSEDTRSALLSILRSAEGTSSRGRRRYA